MNSTKGVKKDAFLEILHKISGVELSKLAEYKEQSNSKASNLKEALLRNKIMKEEKYQEALAQYSGLEFLSKIPETDTEWLSKVTEKIPIRFAKRYKFFPIAKEQNKIKMAVVDPWPTTPYEEASHLLQGQFSLIITSEDLILALINQAYDRSTSSANEAAEGLEENEDLKGLMDLNEENAEDLLEAEDEEPVKKLVNTILFQSVKDKASDIHVDPTSKNTIVRYRIDGVLHQVTAVPKQAHMPLINRIKVMSGLDISTKNQTQDGRTMVLIAGKNIDIRVSILPTVYGERAVLRLLNQSSGVVALEDLGMAKDLIDDIDSLINKPHGIFLVTGATGSGKTTSLYASLSRLDEKLKNIITIEDPVEIKVAGYGQVQVNEKVGLTFAKGLRSILRQDPDVIMVGEIRDAETAQIAIQAALTGHFVLSTLHTNDAVSTIIRLIDMGIEPFLIASTLVGILSQKLVRRICSDCKEKADVPKIILQEAGVPNELLKDYDGQLWKAKGCSSCLYTGYQGRIGVFEFLKMNDIIQQAILANPDSSSIKKVAVKKGLRLLSYDCSLKVLQGITTLDEMLRVTHEVSLDVEENDN